MFFFVCMQMKWDEQDDRQLEQIRDVWLKKSRYNAFSDWSVSQLNILVTFFLILETEIKKAINGTRHRKHLKFS